MPAIAQGSVVEPAPECAPPEAPAALPQRWQNFAPGVRIVAQAAQRAPAIGEPQLEQKCPLAGSPQLGQLACAPVDGALAGGTVICEIYFELKRAAGERYFGVRTFPHKWPPMSDTVPELEISRVDPREPEAAALISAMTAEITAIYDHKIDGAGNFKPEDVLVPGSGFVVGRAGARAVACGAFRPLSPEIAEVKRMFVDREHRGRGYSAAILRALERMAGECGYTTVWLETRPLQTAAIALYEKGGYVRIPNYGMYEGKQECLCYGKSLGEAGA